MVSTEKRPPTPGSWSIILISWAASRSRRPLALPGLAGSVTPRKWSCGSSLAVFTRIKRGDGLHQRFAGAAGFRHRDEAAGPERQPVEQRAVAVGVEVVHEMDARRIAQGAHARHGVAGKLRQGLAAEA